MENENSVAQAGHSSRWLRVVYMILFAVLFKAAEFVMWVVVVFQMVITLATDTPNERLQRFGRQLSIYVCSLWMFLTYNTEKKPFPFSDWPTNSTPTSPSP
jgi:hypothetical protein